MKRAFTGNDLDPKVKGCPETLVESQDGQTEDLKKNLFGFPLHSSLGEGNARDTWETKARSRPRQSDREYRKGRPNLESA
jgi:hypothetical protein